MKATCLWVECQVEIKPGLVFCCRDHGDKHRASLRPAMPQCRADGCRNRVKVRTNKRCENCIARRACL